MIKAINNVSNTSFKGSEVKKEEKTQKTPEQIKNGKKKLAIGLAAAATVAIAGITIAAKVKSGKSVDDKTVQNLTEKAQEVASEVAQEATQGITQKATQAAQNIKLADIKFDKGIASINGEKFTGTVSDTLTGGDKITMTYKDGKIMQSVREGSKNVTKKFEYNCAPCSSADVTKITTLNSEGKVIRETELGFETVDKIKYRTFPDGTTRAWHKNGQIRYEILPDGTGKTWHENGQLRSEGFPDGSMKEWHKNGRLAAESPYGQVLKTWDEDGHLKFERLPDGTEKLWYENGQLRCEWLPDGTEKHFDINGQEIK